MPDVKRGNHWYWRVGRLVVKLNPAMGTCSIGDGERVQLLLATRPGTLVVLAETLREVAKEWREYRNGKEG